MNPLVSQALSHSLDFGTAKDKSNPRSLINILPSVGARALAAIPDEFFDMSIKEVGEKAKIDDELEMMRTAWWIEYNRAQKTKSPFVLSNVCSGICGMTRFQRSYMGNSFRMLYMITPPIDYQVQQHRILNMALEKEIEILKKEPMKAVYNKDGEMIGEEVDTKLLEVQRKIGEITKNRLMGMPVNRTMQVNQNFNSSMPSEAPGGAAGVNLEDMDEEQLQAFIDKSKSEKGLKSDSGVIDVGVKRDPKT